MADDIVKTRHRRVGSDELQNSPQQRSLELRERRQAGVRRQRNFLDELRSVLELRQGTVGAFLNYFVSVPGRGLHWPLAANPAIRFDFPRDWRRHIQRRKTKRSARTTHQIN